MHARALIVTALLGVIGCERKVAADKSSTASAASPAAATGGMLCDSSETWRWSADGTATKRAGASIVQALDGRLFESKRDFDSDTYLVTPLDKPSARAVEVGATDGQTFVIESETSIFAAAGDQLLRGGTWTTLGRADKVASPFIGATVANKRWWIAQGDGVFRTTAGSMLEHVAPQIDAPIAIASSGASVYVLAQTGVGTGTSKAVVWEIDDRGKATQRAAEPLRSDLTYRGIGVASNGVVALIAISPQGDGGPLFRIDGKTATVVDLAAVHLSSIDGTGRLWYQRLDGLVARDATGTTTVYPPASLEMIATSWNKLRCYPDGGGFRALPPVNKLITGKLTVDLSSESAAPGDEVVVCSDLRGRVPHESVPCANDPARITGKVDASLRWEAAVPIGRYGFGVKMSGHWWASTLSCEVAADKPCTLKPRT